MPPRSTAANPLALPPRIYQKHGAFWYVDAARKWHRLGKAWDFAARAEWNKLVSDGAADCRLTVADLLKAYITHRRPHLRPSTAADYDRDAEILAAVFGQHSPRDITPATVQKYLDRCATNNRGVRGNREIALLSAAYNFGIPREWAAANPCAKVQRNPEKPRDRRVTIEQIDHFVAWACGAKNEQPATRAERIVAVGVELEFLCAQSKSDVLKIRRADLDDDGIHIQRGKTGVRICVGWSPRLIAAKERALALQQDEPTGKKRIASMYLIANQTGGAYTPHGWSALFHRVMNAYIATGGLRFSPHDMRAAGATTLLESNEIASNTTGHRQESTLKKHYDRRLERKGKPAA